MNEYNTDIVKLTCSCPDWEKTRYQYKLSDPRRLCKHIINKLDIYNLPFEISKFKENIKFYKTKEWGFRRDFEKIINIDEFTLLFNSIFGWTDIFDNNGNRYAVIVNEYTYEIYWAKNLKPKEYKKIEKYLIDEAEKIPLPLEDEEYPQIINFIKEVLPHKKDFYISIHMSQYVPTPECIIYDIYESKLTPEQERKLKLELLQKYEDHEVYHKLHEATSTLINEENEELTVTNNEIIVKMESGKKYTLVRDFEYVRQLKEKRELIEKERERLWKEEQEKYKKERQKKLEEDRKVAKEKGYILARDLKGNLYNIQDIYNHPDGLSWDEYEKAKNSILGHYSTLQHLIKEFSIDITTRKFNKALKNLNFIVKESILNQNDWILKGDGLQYGINLIKDSKYVHENIPNWYKVHIFDNIKMKLINPNNSIPN